MYVCLCNGITDRDVERIADDPAVRTPQCVHAALNAAPQCGQCLDYIAGILEEIRGDSPPQAEAASTF